MKTVKLNLSEELLERIDQARGDVPRLVWIRRACEQRLPALPPQGSRFLVVEPDVAIGPSGVHIDSSDGPVFIPAEELPDEKPKQWTDLAPIPCTCGGVIYQVGLKKGSCSRCSNPKAL